MVQPGGFDKKSVTEMIAEALREIGALALLLVPIDMIFSEHAIRWRVVVYALASGFLLLILGIVLERIRA